METIPEDPFTLSVTFDFNKNVFRVFYNGDKVASYVIPSQDVFFDKVTIGGPINVTYAGFPPRGTFNLAH